jgi:hypothetical protein
VIRLIGQRKWHVYTDPFHSALEAWETTDFASFRRIPVTTPEGAKHCSMLPITRAEVNALRRQYPNR